MQNVQGRAYLFNITMKDRHIQDIQFVSFDQIAEICLYVCHLVATKMSEVHLSASIYRVFHDDFSSIVGANRPTVPYLFQRLRKNLHETLTEPLMASWLEKAPQ